MPVPLCPPTLTLPILPLAALLAGEGAPGKDGGRPPDGGAADPGAPRRGVCGPQGEEGLEWGGGEWLLGGRVLLASEWRSLLCCLLHRHRCRPSAPCGKSASWQHSPPGCYPNASPLLPRVCAGCPPARHGGAARGPPPGAPPVPSSAASAVASCVSFIGWPLSPGGIESAALISIASRLVTNLPPFVLSCRSATLLAAASTCAAAACRCEGAVLQEHHRLQALHCQPVGWLVGTVCRPTRCSVTRSVKRAFTLPAG